MRSSTNVLVVVLVAAVGSAAVPRSNGTFTSALPITLPATAALGTYEVTTTVTVGDRTSRGFTTFAVR